MNVSEAVLKAVNALYAGMLNRSVWLQPDRVEDQIDMWALLIGRQPGDGVVLVDDFLGAIEHLLRVHPAHEVMPPLIIAEAARTAAARAEQAKEMITLSRINGGALLLYTERCRRNRYLESPDPQVYASADDRLRNDVDRLVDALHNSGYDAAVTKPVVRMLYFKRDAILAAPKPPLRPLDEPREEISAAALNAWLTHGAEVDEDGTTFIPGSTTPDT